VYLYAISVLRIRTSVSFPLSTPPRSFTSPPNQMFAEEINVLKFNIYNCINKRLEFKIQYDLDFLIRFTSSRVLMSITIKNNNEILMLTRQPDKSYDVLDVGQMRYTATVVLHLKSSYVCTYERRSESIACTCAIRKQITIFSYPDV